MSRCSSSWMFLTPPTYYIINTSLVKAELLIGWRYANSSAKLASELLTRRPKRTNHAAPASKRAPQDPRWCLYIDPTLKIDVSDAQIIVGVSVANTKVVAFNLSADDKSGCW